MACWRCAVPVRVVDAKCPLRDDQPCTLCHPDAKKGPQDCPTVALVMADESLRGELATWRADQRARAASTSRAARSPDSSAPST